MLSPSFSSIISQACPKNAIISRSILMTSLFKMNTNVAHRLFHSHSQPQSYLKTHLYDMHIQQNGKMVPFAGYLLPIQYPLGSIKAHLWTREKAGLFDVSHMCPVRIFGKDREKFIEYVSVCDVTNMPYDTSKLSSMLDDNGGMIDDTIITRRENYIYMVLNAGCRDKDINHLFNMADIFKQKHMDVDVQILNDYSLLAFQGPHSSQVLSDLLKMSLDNIEFMTCFDAKINNIPLMIGRSGYTGEDGFEILVENGPQNSQKIAQMITDHSSVIMVGLAARDSLRLEAGMCLYGHDIDENTNPIEAGLGWTITKRRKAEGGFKGYENVKKTIDEGIKKKRIGLTATGPVIRENTPICDINGNAIGSVTSGNYSPSSKKNVAMGYVDLMKISKDDVKKNCQLLVNNRGKMQEVLVTLMPFVPSKYYKKQ